MTKVVYNNCYGGFGLSREAVLLGRKLSNDPNWCGPCIKGDFWVPGKPVEMDYGVGSDLDRTDPILVAVVEQLGKKANGMCADLAIEDLPKGTAYRIDEYDGNESIKTNSDYSWNIA
jgi:hypothetical protein